MIYIFMGLYCSCEDTILGGKNQEIVKNIDFKNFVLYYFISFNSQKIN